MINSFRIIFLLCCSITLAAQEIITDRPDQTESSSTIQKGNLQIESGLLLEFLGEDISCSERNILAPTTLIRYGLLDFAELRIVSQIESVKNNSTRDRNKNTIVKEGEIFIRNCIIISYNHSNWFKRS
jgi:hypothetical protein